MATISSKLADLVANQEIREKRALSVRIICEESGASRSIVEGLFKNTMRRVPLEDLAALCQYLDCEIEDILKLSRDSNETTKQTELSVNQKTSGLHSVQFNVFFDIPCANESSEHSFSVEIRPKTSKRKRRGSSRIILKPIRKR